MIKIIRIGIVLYNNEGSKNSGRMKAGNVFCIMLLKMLLSALFYIQ